MKCMYSWLMLALLPCTQLLADETLTYPRHSRDAEPERYVIELLQLALDHTPDQYHLQPSDEPMNQARAQSSLEHNKPAIQVMWAMTTEEREQRLLPIRIPIYKGLIGWRINLLRPAEQQRLSHISSLEQLKTLRFGQRHDWPDTALLRANGLQVVTSPSYAGLFSMLVAGRFDAFPREVVTVWQEQALAEQAGQHLTVDEHLVLHYPTAFYFFTSLQRPDLAAQISQGLEAAIADGSFEALFERHHAATLSKANLAQRQVIELHNPQLPTATPFARKELWYQPQ